MSFYNSEISTGQTAYVDGKKVTITDTTNASCVVVTDEAGNQFSVRKTALTSTPLFDINKIKENNIARIAKYRAEAEKYEQAQEIALKAQQNYLTQISNLFKEAGTKIASLFNSEQQELYQALKKDYWGSRANSTALGNRVFSCYMAAADAAHDNAMLLANGANRFIF